MRLPIRAMISHMIRRTATMAVGAVLALGACGGGDEPESVATTTTAAAPATEAATTTSATTAATTTTAVPETAPPTTMECTPGSSRDVEGGFQRCMRGTWSETVVTTTTTTLPPTTTTTPGRDGSRQNPFDLRADAEGGPDVLTSNDLDLLLALGVRDADMAAIFNANQFNTEPPPGEHYVAVTMLATAAADLPGTLSYYDVACDLTGDLGKLYQQEFLSDMDGSLTLLSDQPDVLGGGTMAGDVYYLVNDADGNYRLHCDGTFIIPG